MDIKKVQREAHEAVERVVTIARHAEASFAAQIDALKADNARLESELMEARKLLATYAVTVMGDFGGTPVVEVTRSPTCSTCKAPTGACVCPLDPMGGFMAATVEAVAALKPAEEQGPWVVYEKGDALPWCGDFRWSRHLEGLSPFDGRDEAMRVAAAYEGARVITLAEAREIEKARR